MIDIWDSYSVYQHNVEANKINKKTGLKTLQMLHGQHYYGLDDPDLFLSTSSLPLPTSSHPIPLIILPPSSPIVQAAPPLAPSDTKLPIFWAVR